MFCAVTVSDRTLDGITSNFTAWKDRQRQRRLEPVLKDFSRQRMRMRAGPVAIAVVL